MVGKGTYMGGCMGASSLGAGHQGGHRIKVVPTFLGDDNGSKQIDKWGRALPRSRGVRVHSYAKTRATCSTAKRRAGDPDARAPVDAVLTGPHGACQGAAACGVGLG